jgi:hypothetical protein
MFMSEITYVIYVDSLRKYMLQYFSENLHMSPVNNTCFYTQTLILKDSFCKCLQMAFVNASSDEKFRRRPVGGVFGASQMRAQRIVGCYMSCTVRFRIGTSLPFPSPIKCDVFLETTLPEDARS